MSSIEAQERELYQDVWGTVDGYGTHSPGAMHVGLFEHMCAPRREAMVFDAGCGNGAGSVALDAAGYRVTMGDLTSDGLSNEAKRLPFRPVCLWQDLHGFGGYLFGGKFDYVYCTDVLEHIPTAYTMLAVSRMLDIARHGLFLAVSTSEDAYGFAVGQALHKTVFPFTWWRDHLSGVGRVAVARDLIMHGAAFHVVRS